MPATGAPPAAIAGYDELANTYFTEATKLKTWDPQAVRLGPVLCCWWYYWNGANGADKDNHGGDDSLPWWLNQVHWEDEVAGTRSLDIFDIHAYPDGPDMSSFTQAQKQAAAVSVYRDYWDPTLVSPSGTINQPWTTQIQPNRTIAFRIPRLRAIANTIYPGTPLSFTEWSAAFAGESDFSTALGDADAYAILGRERVSLATRWVAPVAANPNYLALKLYTNYDGAHHGFAHVSVAAGNTANPNLFSSYAAVSEDGKTLTLMVINKDPQNSAQVQFALNGFNPTSMTAYTLAASAPRATLASSGGNNQSGGAGSALPQALTVALSPGQSGGTANGASILFTASAGTLSNGTSSGSKVIAVTNSSGVASVTLTLPGNAGQVNVQAEGPYGLGHPVTTFTEASR